jgi:hypothetical protein
MCDKEICPQCYKSVARKLIVKNIGNRLSRLVWSGCSAKGKCYLLVVVTTGEDPINRFF